MAPTEVHSETVVPMKHLKVIDMAMELPVVNDVAKYADVIRSNSTVQSATHAVQAGIKTIADLKTVAAVKDAVLNSSTMSEVVLPRMAGAVESLDSMACQGLNSLETAVPAIKEPTPQLLETTKKAASDYWAAVEKYLSSFTISQVSLGLADKSLDVASSVVAKVGGATEVATPEEAAKMVNRIYKNLGDLQDYLRDLKKRGEPAASDLPALIDQLATRLVGALHVNALLGYLGLRIAQKRKQPGGDDESATADEKAKSDENVKPASAEKAGKRELEMKSVESGL